MIKINLCPLDELESPYPFLPDAVMAVVVAAVAYLGVQYYLNGIQAEIDKINESTASLQQSTAALQPEVQRFDNLQVQKVELNTKLAALQSITVSKIAKYKPVIVFEHFQNLKPDGVWFKSLKYGTEKSPEQVIVVGSAFDNILTAELMTAMRATESQEADQADLRTQVYFSGLDLQLTALVQNGGGDYPDLTAFTDFTLHGEVRERGGGGAVRTTGPVSQVEPPEQAEVRL